MQKTIEINGKELKLVSNAATPLFYRKIYGGDLFNDFALLEQQISSGEVSGESIEIIERVSHVMAYQADKENVTLTAEEWLEQFELLDFVEALPAIVEMWAGETDTTSTSKKKNEKPSEE